MKNTVCYKLISIKDSVYKCKVISNGLWRTIPYSREFSYNLGNYSISYGFWGKSYNGMIRADIVDNRNVFSSMTFFESTISKAQFRIMCITSTRFKSIKLY